jgi:predicted  nucleic acid-binding Zn-ribbon protein
MRKNFFLVTSLLLMAILAIPFVAAASNQNAAYYLQQLTNGFTSLFTGDTTGFIRGLTGSFPLIAVFMIVMGVVEYIASESIFRGAESKKYAAILAIGMALITVWNQGVFAWILGLGTVTLFIIFSVVLVIIIFKPFEQGKRGLAGVANANADLARSRKDEFSAINDAQKVKHEYTTETALENKENQDLIAATKMINNMNKTDFEIKNGLTQILQVMGKLNGARSEGAKIGFKQTIQAQLAAINAKLSAKRTDLGMVRGRVNQLARDMQIEKSRADNDLIGAKELLADAKRTTGKSDDALAAQIEGEIANLDGLSQSQKTLSQSVQKLANEEEANYNQLVQTISNAIETLARDNTSAAMREINTAIQIESLSQQYENRIKEIDNEIYSIQSAQQKIKNKINAAINNIT